MMYAVVFVVLWAGALVMAWSLIGQGMGLAILLAAALTGLYVALRVAMKPRT